jgi:Regulator of chromosome condensation (RCC1) repeat
MTRWAAAAVVVVSVILAVVTASAGAGARPPGEEGARVAGARISTRGHHVCAVNADGTVRCWGDGGTGQLGDGTSTDRSTPVTVSGMVSAVAAPGRGDGDSRVDAGRGADGRALNRPFLTTGRAGFAAVG